MSRAAQSTGVQVIAVEEGSPAQAAGLTPGDRLLEINGEAVLDQLSYQFLMSQRDETRIHFRHPDGTARTATVANGGYGMGVDLAQDPLKLCKQNCVFCFVKQMPPGFRESLYLKDEDIRLSFLYGHFTTLSSSDDAELDRVVREKLSPIHVSVHATDPEARVRVVGNPREGHILRKMDRLLQGGVAMHTQVVLAPGFNDGAIWERTLADLWERRAVPERPGGVLSLSCVPVGLTAHREGLPCVPPVDPHYASAWIHRWTPEARRLAKANEGEPWLLLADEWYTRTGAEVPGRAFYSRSWSQLENGVGLVRRFLEHSRRFVAGPRARRFAGRNLLLLTGASFAPVLGRTLARLNEAVGSRLRSLAVPNRAFGESVTVAGLLCGRDLRDAARAEIATHGPVEAVVVPSSSLRALPGPTGQYALPGVPGGEAQFLDDTTLMELEAALGVPVLPGGENLSQLLENLERPTSLLAIKPAR